MLETTSRFIVTKKPFKVNDLMEVAKSLDNTIEVHRYLTFYQYTGTSRKIGREILPDEGIQYFGVGDYTTQDTTEEMFNSWKESNKHTHAVDFSCSTGGMQGVVYTGADYSEGTIVKLIWAKVLKCEAIVDSIIAHLGQYTLLRLIHGDEQPEVAEAILEAYQIASK